MPNPISPVLGLSPALAQSFRGLVEKIFCHKLDDPIVKTLAERSEFSGNRLGHRIAWHAGESPDILCNLHKAHTNEDLDKTSAIKFCKDGQITRDVLGIFSECLNVAPYDIHISAPLIQDDDDLFAGEKIVLHGRLEECFGIELPKAAVKAPIEDEFDDMEPMDKFRFDTVGGYISYIEKQIAARQ